MSIAVVTGAGGALGRAIARRLAADGHAVAVVDILDSHNTLQTAQLFARTADTVQ